MKRIKFISSLLSAVLVLSAVAVPVAAADVNQDASGGKATVSYTNDSVWTATIPAYVAPVEAGQQDVSAYKVVVKDVIIGDNQQLAATIEYSGYVTEANGVKIPYQLYDSDGEEIQSGDTILSKSAGEPGTEATITFGAALTDSPKYAGVYTDTATFVFTAKDKVYTLDEINADEHLYSIGATKPEYVVAKFNDDYSEVTIFANGDTSDGKMKEWEPAGKSPMTQKNPETIIVKDGVTNIGRGAFQNCTQLKHITLPYSIGRLDGNCFARCLSLESIRIPDGVTYLGYGIFDGCTSLRDVYIPNSVTFVGFQAFRDCTSLENIILPNSVSDLGGSAFQGCTSLKSVSILGTIDKIESNTFSSCSSLESIQLPASVLEIDITSFWNCTALKTVFGVSGSYAETWATGKGLTFIAQ